MSESRVACVQELEARLTNERRDLEKMITEVEQHAAALKEEAASAEEISHKERLIEDKHDENLIKEKELLDYEATLKTKALSLEEHSQALSKLEQQVQDRLQKSEDIEKGLSKKNRHCKSGRRSICTCLLRVPNVL